MRALKWLLLLLAILCPFVHSADRKKPWYRTKKWQERKVEKERTRHNDIEYHKNQIATNKKYLKVVNWKYEGLKEEWKEIPAGSSNHDKIKKKIEERRELKESMKRQKLASDILKNHNNEAMHALWQNVANAPYKHKQIQQDIEKLKSESKYDPELESLHNDFRSSDNRRLVEEKEDLEQKLKEHQQALQALQKKKRFWKWNSFPGIRKKH